MTEKPAKFGWNTDPAIDFEVEVQDLHAKAYNRRVGFDPEPDLDQRVETAMAFRVGGVLSCIAAKDVLREIDAELRSARRQH